MTTPVSMAMVQNSIKAGLVSLGAVAAGALTWQDEQQPAAKVCAILNIVTMAAIQDRETYAAAVAPGGIVWSLSTLYYIRVQVRVESIFNAPGSDALFTLEKLRAGLLRPDLVFDDGVISQPDSATYVHHVPFSHEGRVVSAYAFETGFRAVVDFSLTGPIDAGTNMTEVELVGADATPPLSTQVIDRPA